MNRDLFEAGISFAVTVIEGVLREGKSIEEALSILKGGENDVRILR